MTVSPGSPCITPSLVGEGITTHKHFVLHSPQTSRTPTAAAASPAGGCGCKPLSDEVVQVDHTKEKASRHTNISSYTPRRHLAHRRRRRPRPPEDAAASRFPTRSCRSITRRRRHHDTQTFRPTLPADISHTDGGGGLARRRMRLQAAFRRGRAGRSHDRQPRFAVHHALARRLSCGPNAASAGHTRRRHHVTRRRHHRRHHDTQTFRPTLPADISHTDGGGGLARRRTRLQAASRRGRAGRSHDRQPRFAVHHALARRLSCGPNAASAGNRAHDRRTKCLCVGSEHSRAARTTLLPLPAGPLIRR